jgi:hypothetical protein
MRGTQVFLQLRSAAALARRDTEAAVAAARAASDHVAALGSERMAALQQLAAAQLPALDAAGSAGVLPGIAAELQEFERKRQERSAQLAAEIATHERASAEQAARLAAMTKELDAVVGKRDAVLAEVRQRLAVDIAYTASATAATQAEVQLARVVERAEELRREAKDKLPAYEASRLFQYLWRREFGTPAYRSRGFVARMDRGVAELIGYQAAVASYSFLRTTPPVVQLDVQRRTEEVKALRAQLEAAEDALEDTLGLPALQADVDQRVVAREKLVAEHAATTKALAAAHVRVHEEAGNRGAFHVQALQRLTQFLARTEASALERHAASTPDPRDDHLVATLRATSAEWQRVGDEAARLEREAVRLDAIADGLDDLQVRFQRRDYDAGRSEFDGIEGDLPRMLQEVRSGALPAADLWRLLDGHQRFDAPPPIRHAERSRDVLDGVGLAMGALGVLADLALKGSSRRGGGSFGGGFGSSRSSHTGSRIRIGGGGGGFSTGRTIGGGGGGFSTGRSIGGGGGFSTGKRF